MGAEGAVGILYAKEMKDPNQAPLVAQKTQEYKDTIMTPAIAAQRDYISAIIEPQETRARIAQSLEMLENKTQHVAPAKKHGNIPLSKKQRNRVFLLRGKCLSVQTVLTHTAYTPMVLWTVC